MVHCKKCTILNLNIVICNNVCNISSKKFCALEVIFLWLIVICLFLFPLVILMYHILFHSVYQKKQKKIKKNLHFCNCIRLQLLYIDIEKPIRLEKHVRLIFLSLSDICVHFCWDRFQRVYFIEMYIIFFFFTRWDSVISFSRRGILISHCYQYIVVSPRVISTKTSYLSL